MSKSYTHTTHISTYFAQRWQSTQLRAHTHFKDGSSVCLSPAKQRHTLCLLITLEARGETLSKTLSYPHRGAQTVSGLRVDWPTCCGSISQHMSGPARVPHRAIFTIQLFLYVHLNRVWAVTFLGFWPDHVLRQTVAQRGGNFSRTILLIASFSTDLGCSWSLHGSYTAFVYNVLHTACQILHTQTETNMYTRRNFTKGGNLSDVCTFLNNNLHFVLCDNPCFTG